MHVKLNGTKIIYVKKLNEWNERDEKELIQNMLETEKSI